MKVTKQELQRIIKEELSAMTEAGELEEGFLDKLLGKQPRFGDFVTDDDVKKKLDVVQKNLGDLRGLASNQGNKELGLQVTKISNDVADLYSKTTPKGPELKTITDKPEDITLRNVMSALADPKRRSKLSTQNLLNTLAKIAPGEKPPMGAEGMVDRAKLMDIVQKKLQNMPDVRKYGNVAVRGRGMGQGSIPVAKLEE
jgi:hypothetical protein